MFWLDTTTKVKIQFRNTEDDNINREFVFGFDFEFKIKYQRGDERFVDFVNFMKLLFYILFLFIKTTNIRFK